MLYFTGALEEIVRSLDTLNDRIRESSGQIAEEFDTFNDFLRYELKEQFHENNSKLDMISKTISKFMRPLSEDATSTKRRRLE